MSRAIASIPDFRGAPRGIEINTANTQSTIKGLQDLIYGSSQTVWQQQALALVAATSVQVVVTGEAQGTPGRLTLTATNSDARLFTFAIYDDAGGLVDSTATAVGAGALSHSVTISNRDSVWYRFVVVADGATNLTGLRLFWDRTHYANAEGSLAYSTTETQANAPLTVATVRQHHARATAFSDAGRQLYAWAGLGHLDVVNVQGSSRPGSSESPSVKRATRVLFINANSYRLVGVPVNKYDVIITSPADRPGGIGSPSLIQRVDSNVLTEVVLPDDADFIQFDPLDDFFDIFSISIITYVLDEWVVAADFPPIGGAPNAIELGGPDRLLSMLPSAAYLGVHAAGATITRDVMVPQNTPTDGTGEHYLVAYLVGTFVPDTQITNITWGAYTFVGALGGATSTLSPDGNVLTCSRALISSPARNVDRTTAPQTMTITLGTAVAANSVTAVGVYWWRGER